MSCTAPASALAPPQKRDDATEPRPTSRPARPPRGSTVRPRPSSLAGSDEGTTVAAQVAAPVRPRPAPRPAPVVKQKPDPRPMRLGLGAAAIAALSIMAAGLVRFPVDDPAAADTGWVDETTAQVQNVRVEKRVRYVQLKPGQKAPKGAKVIEAAAPTPRVVVKTIQAAAPAPKVKKTRTRQSGRG